MKVLLVEDSPDNQFLVRAFLGKSGIEVDMADDGVQGVEKALEGDHEVVLMDIQMPRLGGHEATRHLRSVGFTKPIVALTARAIAEEKEHFLESGFSYVLSKPINSTALVELLLKLKSPTKSGLST